MSTQKPYIITIPHFNRGRFFKKSSLCASKNMGEGPLTLH